MIGSFYYEQAQKVEMRNTAVTVRNELVRKPDQCVALQYH
jgi:hypothetical protein